MGSNKIDFDTSDNRVFVNHKLNLWVCPVCEDLHVGMHGKSHAYCKDNNTVFQIDWRSV